MSNYVDKIGVKLHIKSSTIIKNRTKDKEDWTAMIYALFRDGWGNSMFGWLNCSGQRYSYI